MEQETQTMTAKKKWSLASFVCGILLILALLLPNKIAVSLPPLGTIKKIIWNYGPILAIIFGALGLKENKAFSKFGIIIGIIFIVLQFLPILAVLLGI